MMERKTALVFPGQGIQEVGMGSMHHKKHPLARYIYDEVNRITGEPVSRISFEGPEEEQNKTANTQLIIFTLNKVCLELLKHRGNGKNFATPTYVAGSSLGEYNALEEADVIGFEDATRIVQKRGQLMQYASEVNPGGLLATRNPSEETVDTLREIGLEHSLFNTHEQIIFGGSLGFLDRAEAWAKQSKIRVTRLKVGGAFHTSLMEPAVEPFAKIP